MGELILKPILREPNVQVSSLSREGRGGEAERRVGTVGSQVLQRGPGETSEFLTFGHPSQSGSGVIPLGLLPQGPAHQAGAQLTGILQQGCLSACGPVLSSVRVTFYGWNLAYSLEPSSRQKLRTGRAGQGNGNEDAQKAQCEPGRGWTLPCVTVRALATRLHPEPGLLSWSQKAEMPRSGHRSPKGWYPPWRWQGAATSSRTTHSAAPGAVASLAVPLSQKRDRD